jgi:iron complex outermembrane recepter protein
MRKRNDVDTTVHYEATDRLAFDFGIDNVFNERYFLFHPFPGRTFVTAARYKL